MSFGTSIKLPYGTVYFNRVTLRSKYDLLSQQEEADKDLQRIKEELKMMAAGTPKDLFPDEEDVFFRVKQEFDGNWELLEDYFFDSIRARIVLNELDGWNWDHSDHLGEITEEKLDPDNPNDWKRIASGDYYPDTSLRDMESASMEKLDAQIQSIAERYLFKENRLLDKYVLYYKDRLYHTHDGLFLFSSAESARKHFFNNLDLRLSSFTDKKFIEKNHDFMTKDLLPFIEENDTQSHADYLATIDDVKASDKQYDFELTGKRHDYLEQAITNYIMQFVEIKHVEMVEIESSTE